MKRVLFALLGLSIISTAIAYYVGLTVGKTSDQQIPEQIKKNVVPRPLDRYTIDTLAQKNLIPGTIRVEEELAKNDDFTSYLFSYEFDPTLETKEMKRVTGQINIPKGDGPFPLVFMIRGYVDQSIYQTGIGTRRAAEEFAKNGFITLAPDFLGYAGSDSETGNIFETRFQTYTTVLSLLSSLQSINEWDGKHTFLWAHSNGGQIALTTLAITQKPYPTTLWAPVTKPFPYSILYYTDESEDGGKFIRRELAKFEELYDVDKYSFINYLDRVQAPIQIHQGTSDDAIPVIWNQTIVNLLKSKEKKDTMLFIYPGADHNLQPGWNTVVERDLNFFQKHLTQNE